jgi:hypothetical protein
MKPLLTCWRKGLNTMKNTAQDGTVRSRLTRVGRTVLLALPLGFAPFAAGQQAAQAQTQVPGGGCTVALEQLMSQWNSIGFQEPSKPAQQIVAGRHGFSTTGGQFNYLRGQIRVAARDCEAGRDADALQRINTVRGILEHLDHI